jgi:hypothetical protein
LLQCFAGLVEALQRFVIQLVFDENCGVVLIEFAALHERIFERAAPGFHSGSLVFLHELAVSEPAQCVPVVGDDLEKQCQTALRFGKLAERNLQVGKFTQ